MEENIPIYLQHFSDFFKTNYIPITVMAATGFSLLLLRRYCAGGKCYSDARLNEKVAIVTGANTGIGKEAAKDLARRGAKVILACRNLIKAEMAAEEIRKETGNKNVIIKKLDLSSLDSVRLFAKSMIESEPRLDILVNNAGLFMNSRNETLDGFEMTWQTNHLGPFLLTNLLLDLLKKSSPSRIVNVSSIGHVEGKINFEDCNARKGYNGRVAYAQSKLANILFANELARRLKGTGVTSYSLHPGFVATEVFRNMPLFFKAFVYVLSCFISKNPKDGAQTTIYCAVEESLANESGYYYSDCKKKKPAAQALDEDVSKKLWKLSADMVELDDKE